MLKRFFLLILIAALAGGLYFVGLRNKKTVKNQEITATIPITSKPTGRPVPKQTRLQETSVFVPYWSELDDTESFEGYDRLLYFGITPSVNGIVKSEDGYRNMEDFFVKTANKKTWLVVRMTNSDTNLTILNKTGSWKSIAEDTIEAAQQNGFDGIVIDMELGALSSEGLILRINDFMKFMKDRFAEKSLPMAVTLYGDLFYRKRPYDVKTIGTIADEVIIMAYDFHKVYSEPGANFPFDKGKYKGYDFKMMIDDYLAVVPAEKLTITYGMYGYDWLVDEQQRPIRQGKAVTLNEVTEKFLTNCTEKNCVVRRDETSLETEVNYVDEYAGFHIVWFEDTESVKQKQEYGKEQGIMNIAYWAWGYF